MKIAISIDSACDLPKEVIKENNIFCMPYFVTMGENEYRDGVNVTSADLFKFVKENGVLPKTGTPSAEMFKEYFSDILKSYETALNDYIINLNKCKKDLKLQFSSVGKEIDKLIKSKS